MPPARPEILNLPFFTLEYRDGVFARSIPADAEDLGKGLFRQGEKIWRLPDGGESAALGLIRAGNAAMILADAGVSDNTRKKFRDACEFKRVPMAVVSEGSLGHAIGKDNRMIAAARIGAMSNKLLGMIRSLVE